MTQAPYPSILVVEDSDEDFEALLRVMRKAADIEVPLTRCIDGDDALDFLHRQGRYAGRDAGSLPGLILLDLNLPGTDGREVLLEIKQHDLLKSVPVVVLTTSSNPRDVEACYRSGVNSYITKPTNIQTLKQAVQTLLNYWFKVALLPKLA